MAAATAALDYSLADSWEIRIDGTNVTRLVTAGDFEWSILSLNPPAPIVQIGTLQLAANQLSGVSFNLSAIAPNSLVQFYWRSSLVVTARVADVEVTQWDRFAIAPEAVLLNLTDRLRQAFERAAQSNAENAIAVRAARAAVNGRALYCDTSETTVEIPFIGGSVSRRFAIEQVRGLTPDNALIRPASAVTVSGSTEVVAQVNNATQRLVEQVRGLDPQGRDVILQETTRTINPYNLGTRRVTEAYEIRARVFTLAGGGSSSTLKKLEFGSITTQFNIRGLLQSIERTRNISQLTLGAGRQETFISMPTEAERWEYSADGLPSSYTVDQRGIIETTEGNVVEFIARRTVETWTKLWGQFRRTRVLLFPQDPRNGLFNLVQSTEESENITEDQIPSPQTAPQTIELETITYTARAELQGDGEEIDVQLAGIESQQLAQQFCDIFAVLEAKRRIPRRCIRRLANNESVTPFTIEDVGRLRLRRDGIAININGDAVSLSYSGIVEGILSAPVPFPRRTVPTGELYQLPAPGVVPPPLALRIIGLESFTTVANTPIAPISLAAVGGTPPYTFSATGLPAGLSIVGNTILGTPTAPFSGNVTIAVEDAATDNDDTLWPLTVLAVAPVAVPPPESILVIEANSIGTAIGLGAAFVPGVEANSIVETVGTAEILEAFEAASLTLALSQGEALSPVNGIGLTIATSNAESTIELWNPSLITTDLWLDGADENALTFFGDPVAENDIVSTWLDKSGNDRAMEAFSTLFMPTRNQNGLLFDGINDRYQMRSGGDRLALTSNASALTTFHVVDLFSGSNQRNIIRTGASTILHAPGANNLAYRRVSADPLTAPSYGVSTAIDAGITLTSHCIDFENGEALVARNGADYDVYHTFTNTGLTESGFPSTWMGASPLNATTANIDGRIHEVIMIRGVISDPLRQVIEGYLAHKYGIASKLPASHPYKNNPPSSNDP